MRVVRIDSVGFSFNPVPRLLWWDDTLAGIYTTSRVVILLVENDFLVGIYMYVLLVI